MGSEGIKDVGLYTKGMQVL